MKSLCVADRLVKKAIGFIFATSISAISIQAHAEHTPIHRGQLLYENHCTVCHDSTVHIRENHKAKSWRDVQGWVIRWQNHLKLGWTIEEANQVTDYLSETFYKFDAAD